MEDAIKAHVRLSGRDELSCHNAKPISKPGAFTVRPEVAPEN